MFRELGIAQGRYHHATAGQRAKLSSLSFSYSPLAQSPFSAKILRPNLTPLSYPEPA